MENSYRHNHYVPVWYQKQFLPAGKARYYYLDLKPEIKTRDGHTYVRKAVHRWGPKQCFAQDDLYTTNWYGVSNVDIERFFFGRFDISGPKAVAHFANFEFCDASIEAFRNLLPYMSIQKLRTPKGLLWLQSILRTSDKTTTLVELQRLQSIFCTIWGEAVWQIADASKSPTKFIISDHPIVTYNRECFPGSKWCLGANDPDIRLVASHSYYPLSAEKVLILTNLSWVRDPFQNPLKLRVNPRFYRNSAMFNFLAIQHERYLSELEVLQINYITKKRAFRYIAAAEEDWLYPERYLRSTNWRTLGDGYLLMPDPRHIHGGGTTIIGYEDGKSEVSGEYGHKPWEDGYDDKARERHEWNTMNKFKTEWAATYGPEYRGVVYDLGSYTRGVRHSMGEEWYLRECERDREYLKQPEEVKRRRRLVR